MGWPGLDEGSTRSLGGEQKAEGERMIRLFNEDCMTAMASMPDKAYDLAIVDPPYNVGASDGTFGNKGEYTLRGKSLKHYANHNRTPDGDYFTELFRVSKNQIIWGMNYYPQYLYHSGAIIWDKKLTGSPMSDCEIAFQSFSKLVKKCECEWNGFLKGSDPSKERIHPNQKPVRLYEWLLQNYAKPGDKILDTHGGSGSIAIACDIMGFDLDWYEIDKDYFTAAKERLERHQQQEVINFG
jgi:site-specific DNA-methyltransferase (adenine-specific)